MTTLYLIRHGETTWNADGRFQGQQNSPLNESGREQTHIVAQALAGHPFNAIYTSDLDRAADTANLIAAAHGLTPMRDARLREACFGEWEGLTLPQIGERWPDILAAWRMDSLRTRPPGGETLEQVQQRVAEFIAEIVLRHADGHIAIVAHGGSLRAVVTHALGADLSLFRRLRLDNCSISTVTYTDGRFTLVHLNDICHLGTRAPNATWDEAGDQWRRALG